MRIPNSLSESHNDSSVAPPCDDINLCGSPKLPKINTTPYFGVQGHSRSLISAPIESQCTTFY